MWQRLQEINAMPSIIPFGIITLLCFPALAQTRITYRVAPQQNIPGVSNADVVKGVDAFVEQMEAEYNVDFVKVLPGEPASLYIIQRDVPGNQRAVAVPWGSEGGIYPWPGIYLDASDTRPSNAGIVKRVVGHEFGHMYGWPHSSDSDDLMHSNVSAKWFSAKEQSRWIKLFGKSDNSPTPTPKPASWHNDSIPTDVDCDGDTDWRDLVTVTWFTEMVMIDCKTYDRKLRSVSWMGSPGKDWKPDVDDDGVLSQFDIRAVVAKLLGNK